MTISLDQCFAQLDRFRSRIAIQDLKSLLAETRVTLDNVREQLIFDNEHYARNLLRSGPQYYALLLCWKPGQSSPIHDHRGASCGVRVLQGTVTERRYERAGHLLKEVAVHTLAEGGVCGSFDLDIHSICNHGHENLVTLHVYSPSLTNIHIYSLSEDRVEVFTDPFAEQLQLR